MSQPVWSLRAWTPLRSRASDPSPAYMSSRAAGALWTLRRGGHVPTCVRTGVAGTPGTLHPPEAPTPGTFWSKGMREHSPQGVAWCPGARGPPTSLGAPKAAGLPRQQEAHLVDCVGDRAPPNSVTASPRVDKARPLQASSDGDAQRLPSAPWPSVPGCYLAPHHGRAQRGWGRSAPWRRADRTATRSRAQVWT